MALDRQPLCRRVVVPRADACVLYRVEAIPHIVEADRRAVAVGDDDPAICRGVEQLVVGVEGDQLVRAYEVAFRPIDVGRRKRVAHLLEADAARGERGGVDLDPHRIWSLAEDPGLGDALHRRQLLRQDRVGVIVDLVDRQCIGVDGVDQDGTIRGVGLPVGRRVRQVFREETGGGVDRGLDVLRRTVDVALEIELQRDRERAGAARRGHLLESRYRRKLLLERRRNCRCHGVRAGARVIDRHHDGREIDLGQRRHGQQTVGADTEHEHAQHHQRRRDRPANKGLRNAHQRSPLNVDCFKRLRGRAPPVSPPPLSVAPRSSPARRWSAGTARRRRSAHQPTSLLLPPRCRPGSKRHRRRAAPPCRRT